MAVVISTVFEESCEIINGVAHCTTIVGTRHGGPQVDTPTGTPSSTIPPRLSTTSTPVNPTSSPTPEPASPSSTRALPSSMPSSTSSTAGVLSDFPSTHSSPLASSNGSLSRLVPPSEAIATVTSSFPSVSDSTTVTPNASPSNANTSAADSLAATPSDTSPSTSTFSVPFPSHPTSSGHHISAASIAAIAISIAILLVLVLVFIWYTTRRSRRAPAVIVPNTSLGYNANASLSETALTSTTQHALVPTEQESKNKKMEDGPRNSVTGSDRSGSMIVRPSAFEPLSCSRDRSPLSRFLETDPFLLTPLVSAKGGRGITISTGTTTLTDTAFSPSTRTQGTELELATEASRQSTAGTEMEMGSGRAQMASGRWDKEGDGHRDGGDGGSRGRCSREFRYETDGGVCLDGGPPDERGLPGRSGYVVDVDDDQRTIATVVTLPPPYSRY